MIKCKVIADEAFFQQVIEILLKVVFYIGDIVFVLSASLNLIGQI